FDDGVVIGSGALEGLPVLVAAQEGGFMGGAVGEVQGAKIVGLFERAKTHRVAGVVLLLESGGVRLQEANAGLIAVSEVIRAICATRVRGVPVVAAIGGKFGCFGRTGIAAGRSTSASSASAPTRTAKRSGAISASTGRRTCHCLRPMH